MTEHVFADAPQQRVSMTSSDLDQEELKLVRSIVSWDRPNDWKDWIFGAQGRAIFFKSPSRESTLEEVVNGEYDGLQIIGAGGNLIYVQYGVVSLPATVNINPPDRTNHASELRHIVELREVNDHGLFEFSHREYVPLHGMDANEAKNRRTFSAFLNSAIGNYRQQNYRFPFVAPKLAAEGNFPEILDVEGDPLHFQVYRVPRLNRIPGQAMKHLKDSGDFMSMVNLFGDASYLMGCTLRNFHYFGLAYMDGHPGNLSLIAANGKTTLYTTDLGSMKDVSQKKFPARYQALDLYQYIITSYKTISDLLGHALKGVPHAAESISSYAIKEITRRTFEGYLYPEIKSGFFPRPVVHELSRVFLVYSFEGGLQPFAEAFEKLDLMKTAVCFQLNRQLKQ